MGAGRTEFELKFTGAPRDVAKLPESRLFAALAPDGGKWEKLTSTYFDTEDGSLAKRGISLRLREDGAEFIQAVKTKGGSPASRVELETEIECASAFPAATGDAQIDKCIQDVATTLIAIAGTSVDRWAAAISYKGATIELAVDLGRADSRGEAGHIFTGPLAEVELELISGCEGAVFELAKLIIDNAALRFVIGSKLDYALSLPRSSAAPRKAPAMAVIGESTAGDALAAVLNESVTRLADLQAAIVEMRRPEGVHQMRVALRRLRATERLFRKWLPEKGEISLLAGRAKRLASALGPARDWDVFLGETLSAAQTGNYAPNVLKQLKAKAQAERAAEWAAAVEQVSSPEFTHFLIDLLASGMLQNWRKGSGEALQQPISSLAPRMLNRALKKVLKSASESTDEQDLIALHPLRIALKKLRYPAQLFKGLFVKSQRKEYMTALSALQGSLGVVNDAVTAQRLADHAAAEGGEGLMRAAGFVAGYKAAEAQSVAKEIDGALAAFEKMKPFWRER